MPDKTVQDTYNITTHGEPAYTAFVDDRINARKVNLWAPMKRMNLHTWKSVNNTTFHRVGSQVIEL